MYVARQSLGGAAYTAWSGFPQMLDEYSPTVTFEGDNTMLAQQSFNFLSKMAKRAMIGKDAGKLDPFLSYLNELNAKGEAPFCSATRPEHFMNLEIVAEALRVNLLHKLKGLMAKMHDSKVSKKDFVNSVAAIDIVKVAEAHIRFVSFSIWKKKVDEGGIKCKNLRKHLANLCVLYGLW
mmetsp:Transcript_5049/g.7604  ORF Transcript_5049/g.7604 Transcript_5049/m.7604 type:complete len:179 (+) Transcript_5049:337-873(+)